MFREIFKEVKKCRRITGKAISQITGISANHISEYINGKRDVTGDTLWRMIEAMEELSPGARCQFGREIIGDRSAQSVEDNRLEINFDELDENQLADCMVALGKAWKNKQISKNSDNKELLAARR
jgi:transcriptional regulator with XRE-family HTH domain